MTSIAPTLQGFFTERLVSQRRVARTVASYRDWLKLLLAFAQQATGKPRPPPWTGPTWTPS